MKLILPPQEKRNWSIAKEIASRESVSVTAIYHWVRDGQLKATRLGSLVRISDSDWQDFKRRSSQ